MNVCVHGCRKQSCDAPPSPPPPPPPKNTHPSLGIFQRSYEMIMCSPQNAISTLFIPIYLNYNGDFRG